MTALSTTPCVKASQLIDLGNGKVAAKFPDGSVMSVQPDGSIQSRPATAIGPWETAVADGGRLVYADPSYGGAAYALLLVNA